MKPSALLLLLAVQLPARAAEPPKPANPQRAEAERRTEALIHDGFNYTRGIKLNACDAGHPLQAMFIFPESGKRQLSFWMETANDAEAKVTLLGPQGEAELLWSGSRGESAATRELAAGKYSLQIECVKPLEGEALLGIKGSAVSICATDPARVEEVPSAPALGFYSPYILYIPEKAATPHLLVVPNNTGFGTESVELLRASASCDLKREGSLAAALGAPLLIPLFPRPPLPDDNNIYLHALTREALSIPTPAWKRVDLQLVEMIRDARARLKSKGIDASGKVLITGFSASASFANRFAMLHPEEVLAAAVGSPGGWPLAPVAAVGKDPLPYPVGVADLESLTGHAADLAALRKVRWFFYIGADDENDAVIYRDSFSSTDEALIFRLFGKTPASRWKAAEALYAKQGLQARFAMYPHVAHSISPEMRDDVEKFFKGSIELAR